MHLDHEVYRNCRINDDMFVVEDRTRYQFNDVTTICLFPSSLLLITVPMYIIISEAVGILSAGFT